MNSPMIFNAPVFGTLRAIMKGGEPWFVAADVCRALEIGNPSQALARLDDDEKITTLISNEGAASGKSSMAFVNEPGLYALVLGSRKPEAKAFKRWITHVVIPAIRKHGGYLTAEKVEEALLNPDVLIRLATELKDEREARRALESKVAEDAPKVLFAKAVEQAENSILVGDLAKLIKQNGTDIGQKRLFARLREEGYLGTRGENYNMPTQRAMEMQLFHISERTINNPDGSVRLTRTVKVTGKGQVYFINRYAGGDRA